jgi:hypothetical protein
MAKQRKEKEQNEAEERSSRWLRERGKNSLEIHLGSSWFVYFYHLICNFCFRNSHVVQISDCPWCRETDGESMMGLIFISNHQAWRNIFVDMLK